MRHLTFATRLLAHRCCFAGFDFVKLGTSNGFALRQASNRPGIDLIISYLTEMSDQRRVMKVKPPVNDSINSSPP